MDLIDTIFDFLDAEDFKSLLDHISPTIPLEYINDTSKYFSLLKIYFLPFLTWLNCSKLHELIKNKHVAELLKIFSSLLDFSQNYMEYHFPAPSQLIIPNKNNFTVLVTQSKTIDENSSLNDILQIKTLFTNKWKITEFTFQLAAVQSKRQFWMIPTNVGESICNNLMAQYELWNENGVTLSFIFPTIELSHNTIISDKVSATEPLNFFDFQEDIVVCTSSYTVTYECYFCLTMYIHGCPNVCNFMYTCISGNKS